MSPALLVFKTSVSEPPHAVRVTEVAVKGLYELEDGDVVLDRSQAEVVVRREVELTADEKALVQAGVNYGRATR